jgi:FkbH-like protein
MGTGAESRSRVLSRIWRAHGKTASDTLSDITIGFASSFTISSLLSSVGGRLLEQGSSNPQLLDANYNQLMSVCLNPAGEFGGILPDVIVLMWRLEDLADPSRPDLVADAFETLKDGFKRLRSQFNGTIVLAMPPKPRPPVEGVVLFARPSQLLATWYRCLVALTDLVHEHVNTYSVDMEAEITRLGEAASLDVRKEYLYRQPFSDDYFVDLAEQIVRICEARLRPALKCIVVDCDNTLWGGIVGEDGIAGVELSDDYPGRPFRDFQKQLKALRLSGIFLALSSKNNPADVEAVFAQHSAMALSWDDISVSRVNWRPKSDNIREIAAELNIGLSAVMFIDDNAFEIEEVRAHAPEVLSLQVPADVAELPDFFRELCRHFDRLEITQDDRSRVDMQRSEITRRDLQQQLTETEFLATLGLTVRIKRPEPSDYARVTQLINKTNQFNLTTKRYTLEEITELSVDGNTHLYCASVSDRFGDYGLVGVGIIRDVGDRAIFDTLLMSCRVLGRGVETALLSYGIEGARQRGRQFIEGHYIPTPKNAMVEQLFARHGFAQVKPATATQMVFTRSAGHLPVPDYLAVFRESWSGSDVSGKVASVSNDIE